MRPCPPVCAGGLLAAAVLLAAPARAWVLTISPGAREIYLQVGAGTYVGGDYDQGGTPATNATINTVSVSLAAAAVGDGVVKAMTSDSTVADSFYDGRASCRPPRGVYVGAWSRAGSSDTASLTVSTPASLTDAAGDSLPFSQISWTSKARGDAHADIAAGAFNGGSLALASIAPDTWVEDCLTFSYHNSVTPAAGTYTGRAVYTLSLP